MSSDVSRRDALTTLAVGGAVLLTSCQPAEGAPQAADPKPAPDPKGGIPKALGANHTVVPLPFAAGSLTGLSEKMLSSHHDNNYASAVHSLNLVEKDIGKLTPETPPFMVSALRDRELTFRNSKSLHEAYFANLGGNGKRSGAIEAALAQAYGTSARWEQQMRATGMGLAGGSGWAILAYELETGALRTFAARDHTQVLANSVPLLVLDMYEHAYQMDYGAAAGRYIDAFFANVNWEEVNRRLSHAEKTSAAFRATKA